MKRNPFAEKLLKFKHFFSPLSASLSLFLVPTLGITYFSRKKKQASNKNKNNVDEKEFQKSKTKNTNRKFLEDVKNVERKMKINRDLLELQLGF
jgi:hypothetical protein